MQTRMRIKTRIRKLILVLISISLLPALSFLPSISATTLAKLSLDQIAAGSDAVARVRCTAAESRWENGSIWTLATVQILENMKGSLPVSITIRVPGGRVGHLTATVDATPKFAPGNEAVVFLQRSRAGDFTVAGWAEGTFRISRDPHTGAETVTQDSSAFAVFDATSRTFRTEGIRRMPIDEFRARMAAALDRSREKNR